MPLRYGTQPYHDGSRPAYHRGRRFLRAVLPALPGLRAALPYVHFGLGFVGICQPVCAGRLGRLRRRVRLGFGLGKRSAGVRVALARSRKCKS